MKLFCWRCCADFECTDKNPFCPICGKKGVSDEKMLKGFLSIFKEEKLETLLYQVIDCWKAGTNGNMSKEAEAWHNQTCDICPDEQKGMCEMWKRFLSAVIRNKQGSEEEIVAHINFVNGFKNLTQFYYN